MAAFLLLLAYLAAVSTAFAASGTPASAPAAGPTYPPPPPPPPSQYVQYQEFYQQYDALGDANSTLAALNETHLDVALTYLPNVTFLAPSNAAWLGLTSQPRGPELAKLLSGKNATLVTFNLLLFHTLSQFKDDGELQATTAGAGLPTLFGEPLFTESLDAVVYLFANASNSKDNASVVSPNVIATTIFVGHEIDRVLIPRNPLVLLTPRPGLVPYVPKVYPPPSPSSPPPSASTPSPTKSSGIRAIPEFIVMVTILVCIFV